MKDIDLDIQLALNVPLQNRFCEYGPVFSNACENLEEVEKRLNYKNKDILLPLSSGDQCLFALYKDSKSITTYDINKLTKYYVSLKISAFKTFTTLNDFLKFLITDDYNLFNTKKEIISKLFDNLDKNSLYFWKNYLEKATDSNLNNLVKNKTFRLNKDYIQTGIPFYKNDTEYKKLRNKLINLKESFKFINSDLFYISSQLDKKYDIIDLSNIISTDIYDNYYDNLYDNLEDNWIYVIKNELLNHLNNNGSIIIDYIYNDDLNNKQTFINSKNIIKYNIDSKQKNSKDSIYVYKK